MTVLAATAATGERVSDFAAFFHDTWPDLQQFCLRTTGSSDLADELAQEAMTRVYTRFPLLREPRPYVFRVAANLVRRAWRTRTDELVTEIPVAGPNLDTLDAVRRLPDRLREVVLLHYWADLPVKDVATALHRPVGTVKRRLSEARAQLATDLTEES